MAFIHKVAFERFEKESSCFLNLIVFEEDLGYCFDWGFWVALGVTSGDHFGEAYRGLWVARNDWAEDFNEVWAVVHLLAVRDNLVELVRFNKSLDNFVWVSRFLERFKRQLRIVLADSITKFITHREFVIVDPAFNKCHFALLENGAA